MGEPSTDPACPWTRWLALCAIVLGPLALYGPGLDGGLIWDDFGYVFWASQFDTVEWWKLPQWFWVSRELYPMGTYRPVLELSYIVEYELWGIDAFGYRFTNLLMHIATSLLLVGVARRLGLSRRVAWAAGVLFAISPAHPESCMWLSCRVNLLAALGFVGALRAHLGGHWVRALGWAFVAFGSKETAYVLPPLLAGLAYWRSTRRGVVGRAIDGLRTSAGMWLLLGVYIALRFHTLGEFVGGYEWREPPDWLSWDYLRERIDLVTLALAPVNLERVPESLKVVLLVFHGVGAIGLCVAACRPNSRIRTVARFCLLWFVLANVPIYNAPFVAETSADLRSSRLLYEPTLAIALGVAAVLGGFRISVFAALACLSFGVALGNVGPWVEVEAVARELDRVMRIDPPPDHPVWIVDLPELHDGAFLFPGEDPRYAPPFARPESAVRITVVRERQWRRVLRRIDEHIRGGRVDGLELRAIERLDGRTCEFVRTSIAASQPAEFGGGVVVRCARVPRSAGGTATSVRVHAFLELGKDVDRSPLTVRLHWDAEGFVHEAAVEIPDGEGQVFADWAVAVPEIAPAGTCRIRLVRGPAGVDCGVVDLGSGRR